MGIIVRILYIGKLIRGLLFICTLLQRSLVTSQILALSEVKAIMFSGRYVTRLVTYVLLPRVACVVILWVCVPGLLSKLYAYIKKETVCSAQIIAGIFTEESSICMVRFHFGGKHIPP